MMFKIPLNAVPNNKQSKFIKENIEKSTKNKRKTTVIMIQHFFFFFGVTINSTRKRNAEWGQRMRRNE